MGKLGGFLQIERHGIPQRDPRRARRTTTASSCCSGPSRSCATRAPAAWTAACPSATTAARSGNLIPDWNDLVYRDRFEDAIAQLHATNNFPEFTGRLCPAPCEAACVLEIREGDAVTIKQIENAIIDRAWEEGWVTPRPPRRETGQRRSPSSAPGPAGHGRRPAAAPRRATRVTLFERDEAARRARALRRARLQDREVGRAAARRAARRRGRRAALRRRRRPRRERARSCARASTRSCWRPARACRATCRSPGASSTACTSRWTTSTSATAGSRASSAPSRASPRPPAEREITRRRQGRRRDRRRRHRAPTASATRCARARARSSSSSSCPSRPRTVPTTARPWPLWPLKYRLSYAMEEASELGRRRAGLLGRDDRASRGDGTARVARAADRAGRARAAVRAGRRAPSASCRPSSCCWRWASCTPSRSCSTSSASRRTRAATSRRVTPYTTSVEGVFAAGDARRGQSLIVWAINEGRQCARMVDRYLAGARDGDAGRRRARGRRARRPRRRRRRARGPAAARRAGDRRDAGGTAG